MRKLLSLVTLLMLFVASAWADTVVLSTPTESVATLSDANGLVTISDVAAKTGIQAGSSSYKLSYDGTDYVPMKLSGSRQFKLTYSDAITVTKVTLIAMSNGDGEGTIGQSSSDQTSLGTFPVRGSDKPLVVDITDVTDLNASRQFLCIIVVEYSSTAPSLSVDPKELSFAVNPAVTTQIKEFTLKGKNLADGQYTLTVPNVAGLSVAPTAFTVANGAVDQAFEVTYTSTADVAKASADITATVGNMSATVAVSYQSRATAYTQSTVSDDATWDWSKLTETVELTDETTPKKSSEFLLADLDDRISFTEGFGDPMAIKMEGMQFPSRGGYAQGTTIKFTTSVPGIITVDFSNTGGGDRPLRYLNVNGVNTEFASNTTTKVNAVDIVVPAGEVVLMGNMVDDAAANGFTPNMLRWYKITFTAVKPSTATFDFSSADIRENIGTAMTDVKGWIYNETFTADDATLQVTAGSAASRIYVDSNRGQNLVTYKEYTTLTFRAPQGKAITKIEFTAAGNSNINNFTASSGTIEGMTWTGNADGVRFQQGGTSYLAKAVVTMVAKDASTAALPAIEYTEVANIAAFNALENGTYAKLTLKDAEITGKSADGYSTVFIQDATGGCWIQYTSLNDQLQEKTKVSGTIYTVKRVASGNPQIKETEDTPKSELTAEPITDFTMVSGTIDAVNVAANLNKVVKITGAELEMTSATAGKLTQGESTIDVNNGTETANQQLHKIADWTKDTKMTDVTIVAILAAKSTTANQLLPITIEGTTTGIQTVNAAAADVNIFNLQGQRMNSLTKGMNIVNGKKVMVK